jgi:hypothetical protein
MLPLQTAAADGRPWSYTFWVDGITDALMPAGAEFVCFGRVGEDGGRDDRQALRWASMEAVRGAAGELLEPTGHVPPRYRVRAFPNEAQLAAMGASGELPLG